MSSEREVGLACLDFLDVAPDEFVRAAADAGFDAVTLRVSGSRSPVAGDLAADPGRLDRVRLALADTGLAVQDVEVLRMCPDLGPDELTRAVELAALLEARHLLVVDETRGREEAVDHLGRIVEIASECGVRPCLEFIPFYRSGTLQEAIAVATAAGAGVLVDVLHLHRSGGTPTDLAHARDEHGANLFPYVQVCDAPAAAPAALRDEAVAGRLLPGAGDLPLDEVLGSLPRVPLVVEAPGPGRLPVRARAAAARRAVTRLNTTGPSRTTDPDMLPAER